MRGPIVDVSGPAIEDQRTGGVEAGKVGAKRFAVAIDQAVRQYQPADHREDADAEQDQAIAAYTLRREPFAGSQALPEMSHFAAEFYECCVDRNSRPLTFSKVRAFRAKLLAMPRASP